MNSASVFYWILGLVFTGFILTGMVIHRTRTTVHLIDSDLDQLVEWGRNPAALQQKLMEKPTVRFSVGELMVNVQAPAPSTHFLKAEIDLELFDENAKEILSQNKAAIRHEIIQAAYEQDFDSLNSLGGKLYFKELVTSRLNTFVNMPAVKNVHFTTFYLQ